MEGILGMLRGMRIFLAEEGGAAGSTGGEGEGAAGDTGGTTQGSEGSAGGTSEGAVDKGPTYLSQAPKEFAEQHKDFFKAYPKLTDVLSAHLKATESLKRAIVVPDKEKATPEEVKAFYKKMGIPEAVEGYELKADEKIPEMGEVAKIVGKKALEAGLTKAQGKTIWETVSTLVGAGMKAKAENLAAAEAALPGKLTEAYGGEKDKATETMNLFKAMTVRIGNKDVVKSLHDSGLMYNPAFVATMAKIEKEIGDDSFLERIGRGSHKGEPAGRMGNYSPEFDAYAGDKK